MKRDFSKNVFDIEGKDIVENGVAVTFSVIAKNALMGQYKDEEALSGEEKVKRYKLAMRIEPKVMEISVEETGLLKTLIGKAYGVLLVGQAYAFLEEDAE